MKRLIMKTDFEKHYAKISFNNVVVGGWKELTNKKGEYIVIVVSPDEDPNYYQIADSVRTDGTNLNAEDALKRYGVITMNRKHNEKV